MKKILLSLLSVIVLSCSTKQKKVSVETTKKFEAIEVNGNLEKGKLINKESIGFYKSGNQKFSFKNGSDSLMFPDKESIIKKSKGTVDFYYKDENLIIIRKKINDSIYVYNPDDLKTPTSIQVLDSNKNVIKNLDFTYSEETIYIHEKIDEFGNPLYTQIIVSYLPSEFDKQYKTDVEIQKLKLENDKKFIEEKEYIYY